jgi:hypothetical protein
MSQNAINDAVFGARGFVDDVKFPAVFGSNLSTGDNDLYTVPAGKKAMVTAASFYAAGAGNVDWFLTLKSGGTYYRITANATATLGTASSFSFTCGFIAQAGESFAINTATNTGLNVWLSVIEFTNGDFTTGRVLTLANGDNTIYTVPATNSASPFSVLQSVSIVIVNDSGANRTYNVYVVPSGGSAGATNKIRNSQIVADNLVLAVDFDGSLKAGDFIVVNTSSGTATQSAFVGIQQL